MLLLNALLDARRSDVWDMHEMSMCEVLVYDVIVWEGDTENLNIVTRRTTVNCRKRRKMDGRVGRSLIVFHNGQRCLMRKSCSTVEFWKQNSSKFLINSLRFSFRQTAFVHQVLQSLHAVHCT